MYFKDPNKRVFNVNFGDTRIISGIDTVAKVGTFNGLTLLI